MMKIPSLEWIKNYKRSYLNGDLVAGLTVGVMLIPQGMAYAMIAGLPPIYGLYASIIPIVIYAFLGTSRQLAVGPVAMVSLLTATGISSMAAGGTEEYIALAITLAFLVGAIQFLLGVFRLGFLVQFLSHPVISGFTSAAALIIGLSQLKHLLGVNIPRSHHIHEILYNAFLQAGQLHWITFLIGIVGISIIVVLKKIKKSIPGALIAVVAGILIVTVGGLESKGVSIVGNVPDGLPGFGIPQLDASTISSLIYVALAISLVSFMESIAVAKAIQAKHKDYEVIPNQELIALGLANIGGSFFQAFPTTGGFSRTAVNNDAGAKTGLASLISVALIVVTLLFFTPLFHNLPNAILAAVIMVAVFGLVDYKEAMHLWKTDKTDFILLLATFLATATLGIEIGIAIGVILSISMLIFRTSRPHMAELGLVRGTNTYRNINRFNDLEIIENTVIVRLDAQLFFANAGYVKDKLISYIDNKKGKIKFLILNAESISYVDSTGVHMLHELFSDLKNDGITFLLSGVIGPVRDTFEKSHLIDRIGEDHFFMNVKDAIDHTKGENGYDQAYQKLAIQSNISE